MVAVSFGSYASAAFADGGTTWIKVFAVLLVLAMTLLNTDGSQQWPGPRRSSSMSC
jgi:hypothetical protein